MTSPYEVAIDSADLIGVASVISWAGSSGLLGELETGRLDVEQYCQEADLHPENLWRVLRVLEGLGMVVTDSGDVCLSDLWDDLNQRWPLGISGVVDLWEGIEGFAHGYRGPLSRASSTATHYKSSVSGMRRLYEERAAQLADQLRLPREGLCLDLGAGSGVWSEAILERKERWAAVALDLPVVISRCASVPRRSAVAALAECLPFRDDSVDLILVANLLHSIDPSTWDAVLAECSRVCHQDGGLVVIDVFRRREIELATAVYDLNLGIRGGRLLSDADVVARAMQAGFRGEGFHNFDGTRQLLRAIRFRVCDAT